MSDALPPLEKATFLGMAITPLTQRRLRNFRANGRGFWSMWIFLVMFVLSLFAEFIANDKPLFVSYDGEWLFPVVEFHAETEFGGFFETEAEYREPEVKEMINEKGWMVWPLIEFSYNTYNGNNL